MTIPSPTTALHRATALLTLKPCFVSPAPERADDIPKLQVFGLDSARAEDSNFECAMRADRSVCTECQDLAETASGIFCVADDDAASEHVIAHARAGCASHPAALRIVDPVARPLIRFWCPARDQLP